MEQWPLMEGGQRSKRLTPTFAYDTKELAKGLDRIVSTHESVAWSRGTPRQAYIRGSLFDCRHSLAATDSVVYPKGSSQDEC